jgi:multidrug resistance efflux pump
MKKFNSIVLIGVLAILLSACSTAAKTAVAATDVPVKADPMILSEGRVEPASYAEVGFNAGGVVSELLVKEGDSVQAGQVLVRLNNLDSLKAEEVRARETYLTAKQSLDLSQTENLQNLAKALEARRSAQQKLDEYSVPSDFDGLTPDQAVKMTSEKVEKARKAYEPYRGFKRADRYVRDLGRSLDDAWADYNQAVKWMTLEANLHNAQVQVDQAQAEFDNQGQAAGDANVSVNRAKFETAEANLAAATAALNNAELKAPIAGTVAKLDIKPGEPVSPNQVVATIADFSGWIVKTTDLTEIDVVSLKQGQPATVVLDALPDSPLKGEVTSIGQTYAEVQGDVVYTVTVHLSDTNPQMRWGMTADVKFPRQ